MPGTFALLNEGSFDLNFPSGIRRQRAAYAGIDIETVDVHREATAVGQYDGGTWRRMLGGWLR